MNPIKRINKTPWTNWLVQAVVRGTGDHGRRGQDSRRGESMVAERSDRRASGAYSVGGPYSISRGEDPERDWRKDQVAGAGRRDLAIARGA